MNITGKEIMIFAKEFNGKMRYRAGMSSKKMDGTYDSAYIDVKLPKDTKVENKTKIDIIQGFLSFYKTKEGNVIWYIVVQQFAKSIELGQEVMVVESKTAEEYDDLPLPF